MVVPDEVEGPVRKRPKLSLRHSRKSEPLEAMNCSNDLMPNKVEDIQPSGEPSKTVVPVDYEDRTADLPSSSDPTVPLVASLYNLGNTCFMNSILEVLRYTPGFLKGLEKLKNDIEEVEAEEEPSDDIQLIWSVVKNTYQLYKDMENREKDYKKVATCDSSSMAVRPAALLDNIRELNPMFEGHFQHDAQELLRCLLCFIEDAHKGLIGVKKKKKEKCETKLETEKMDSKEDKCNAESPEHNIGTTVANIKSEAGSELVLKGGSTDSQSINVTMTRAQSKKLRTSACRSFMDCYFNVRRTCSDNSASTCDSDKSAKARLTKNLKEGSSESVSSTSRKRKRSSSGFKLNCEEAASCQSAKSETVAADEDHSPNGVNFKDSPSKCNNSDNQTASVKQSKHLCISSKTKIQHTSDTNQPSILSMFSEKHLRATGCGTSDPQNQFEASTDAVSLKDTSLHSSKKNLPRDYFKGNVMFASDSVGRNDINTDQLLSDKEDEPLSSCPLSKSPALSTNDVKGLGSDDISDIQDGEVTNLVANKYTSERPESPTKLSSYPSLVNFPPGPAELVVASPECPVVGDSGDCCSYSSVADKDAHVILHSPFKMISEEHIQMTIQSCEKRGDKNNHVKKLFPPSDPELSEFSSHSPAAVLFGGLPQRISISAPFTPTSFTLSAQKVHTCQNSEQLLTSNGDITPDKTLQMQLKKCDWLGVSPVNSVSAKWALSAIDKDDTSIRFTHSKKKLFFGEMNQQETVHGHKPQPVESDNLISKTITRKRRSHDTTVSRSSEQKLLLPEGVTLKPLRITLDKCDWILPRNMNHTVKANNVMLNLKGLVSPKLEPTSVNLSSLDIPCTERNASLDSCTLVEHLFGGTMMHRTKCIECEMTRERQEVFMDISVPIKNLQTSDQDSDDDCEDQISCSKDFCLAKLMQAFTNVERLKENNKYFCEECNHYVEAERSCHYTKLPHVLTLHLKRFGSSSGLSGGVSKLNDRVIISQHLPCLQYMCKQNCQLPSHRYSLYAVVTHSGSILRGHYRAYVKVQKSVNPTVFANLWRRKCKTDPPLDASVICEETSSTFGSSHIEKCTPLSADQAFNGNHDGYSTNDSDCLKENCFSPTCFWLECDDECVRVLDEAEFISKLEEGEDGVLLGTPYILFYHRLTVA
ncbi:hypothetical protein Btru_011434 [Bulinus truncatus]|nr:hypothetical protein Btru_011434 [Bulinus truncatus]